MIVRQINVLGFMDAFWANLYFYILITLLQLSSLQYKSQ